MTTQKKFFIYFILIAAFFIISQFAIYAILNTTYKYKSFDIKTSLPITVEHQATSINGFVKGKILNNTDQDLKDKYLKIECFSKNNVLMVKKYIKIENVPANSAVDYDIRYNFNKVERAEIDIVDEVPNDVPEEDRKVDEQLGFIAIVAGLMALTTL